jgi:hypothetical protein
MDPFRSVKTVPVKRRDSLPYVAPQFLPGMRLRGDGLSDAIRGKASVNVLINLKYDFIHADTLRQGPQENKITQDVITSYVYKGTELGIFSGGLAQA